MSKINRRFRSEAVLVEMWVVSRDSLGAVAEAVAPISILRQGFGRCFPHDAALAAAACSRIFAALPASSTPRSSMVALVLGSTPQYP
jgi:hypothetical protein